MPDHKTTHKEPEQNSSLTSALFLKKYEKLHGSYLLKGAKYTIIINITRTIHTANIWHIILEYTNSPIWIMKSVRAKNLCFHL